MYNLNIVTDYFGDRCVSMKDADKVPVLKSEMEAMEAEVLDLEGGALLCGVAGIAVSVAAVIAGVLVTTLLTPTVGNAMLLSGVLVGGVLLSASFFGGAVFLLDTAERIETELGYGISEDRVREMTSDAKLQKRMMEREVKNLEANKKYLEKQRVRNRGEMAIFTRAIDQASGNDGFVKKPHEIKQLQPLIDEMEIEQEDLKIGSAIAGVIGLALIAAGLALVIIGVVVVPVDMDTLFVAVEVAGFVAAAAGLLGVALSGDLLGDVVIMEEQLEQGLPQGRIYAAHAQKAEENRQMKLQAKVTERRMKDLSKRLRAEKGKVHTLEEISRQIGQAQILPAYHVPNTSYIQMTPATNTGLYPVLPPVVQLPTQHYG